MCQGYSRLCTECNMKNTWSLFSMRLDKHKVTIRIYYNICHRCFLDYRRIYDLLIHTTCITSVHNCVFLTCIYKCSVGVEHLASLFSPPNHTYSCISPHLQYIVEGFFFFSWFLEVGRFCIL